MKISVEVGNAEIQEHLRSLIRAMMPSLVVRDENIKIEVQSKQNFRVHEWESGLIRARIEIDE